DAHPIVAEEGVVDFRFLHELVPHRTQGEKGAFVGDGIHPDFRILGSGRETAGRLFRRPLLALAKYLVEGLGHRVPASRRRTRMLSRKRKSMPVPRKVSTASSGVLTIGCPLMLKLVFRAISRPVVCPTAVSSE